MTAQTETALVSGHYTSNDLTATILKALKEAGQNLEDLSTDDLAAIDQMHTGGKSATLQLAQVAGIAPAMSVLDVGGGLGGPARTLAGTFKCQVTVLELSQALCQTGEILTKLTSLDKLVTFERGSAYAMPFADATFEVVWTQHSSMNMSDKEGLYREVYRVLRSGGKLAFQEVMAGSNSPLHYPVPWATDDSISFVRQPEEIRGLLHHLGFKELIWHDTTAALIQGARERLAASQSGVVPPTLGMHLILGRKFNQMVQNAFRNLEEERVSAIEALFQKA